MDLVCGMEASQSADIKKIIRLGHAEGVSFLVLLLIAMPMKYFLKMPLAVTVAGAIHGVLFIAFLWQLYAIFEKKVWNLRKCAYAVLLSILPTGTFFLK